LRERIAIAWRNSGNSGKRTDLGMRTVGNAHREVRGGLI
jgi:hypothetical protein